MTDEEKEEKTAMQLAQLIKDIALRIVSPGYREMCRVIAQDRRIKYLSYIEAGFTDAQALKLCKD